MLIVAAGDAGWSNHKYKEKFHTKAKMLTPGNVELVGHAVGSVCPIIIKEGVQVYLDPSLRARCDLPGLRAAPTAPSASPGGAGAALGRRVHVLQTP